jgi:putative transposase
MATPYRWRELTEKQREEILAWRKARNNPWHSPPHRPDFGRTHFHITAACYEHAPIIGQTPERMDKFSEEMLGLFGSAQSAILGWCVLPNHYHALIQTDNVLKVLHELGRLHGRLSFSWNGEDATRGRKVFHGAVERSMRSERHTWATLNYIHHNSVHHGYANRWQDWPWSSAAEFIKQRGRNEAERIWREYPTRDCGAGWDDATL